MYPVDDKSAVNGRIQIQRNRVPEKFSNLAKVARRYSRGRTFSFRTALVSQRLTTTKKVQGADAQPSFVDETNPSSAYE